MGSFLEKYNGVEWDVVADKVLDILEEFEMFLRAKKLGFTQKERVRFLADIKKLKKDFTE